MIALLRQCLGVFVALSLMTGVVYPALVTLVAQGAFPRQANGSAIEQHGRSVGSELLGQPFSAAGYFWSRPSATAPQPYNGAASSGCNQAPTNPALIAAVVARADSLRAMDPGNRQPVPSRPGHRLRQRPRPAHLAGGSGVPGDAGGRGPRHDAGAGAIAGPGAY